jgi:MFS family permease
MTPYRDILNIPAQRRLLLAAIPADFADWFDYVAVVALIAYVWGEGPVALALLALAFALPYVVAGPLLAAWVDRADLKLVLLFSNLGRGVLTFALVIAPNVEVLLLIVLVRGVVDSAFTPARQSAIQLTTPEALLMAANGLHQGINQASKIVAPACGGLLLALIPAQGVFAINGVLSVAAFLILLGLQLPPRAPVEHDTAEPFLARVAGGITEFGRNRLLLAVLIFASAANFTFFLYDTQIALLTSQLGYDATAFGLTITASGIGGIIGASLAGLMRPNRPLLLMALSALVSGPVTVATALAAAWGVAIPFPLFCLVMAVMGGTTVFMLVPYRSVIQSETPPDRIARVTSAGEAAMTTAMMSAPLLGSLIVTGFGVPAPFIVGGGLIILLGLGALAFALAR